jgi:hypothetical protein
MNIRGFLHPRCEETNPIELEDDEEWRKVGLAKIVSLRDTDEVLGTAAGQVKRTFSSSIPLPNTHQNLLLHSTHTQANLLLTLNTTTVIACCNSRPHSEAASDSRISPFCHSNWRSSPAFTSTPTSWTSPVAFGPPPVTEDRYVHRHTPSHVQFVLFVYMYFYDNIYVKF